MPLLVLIVLVAVISVIEPAFIPGGGIRVTAVQAVPIILLASGQMFALLLGGIDLSNAAIALFCTVLSAKLLISVGGVAPILTIAAGALIGALVGFLSGWLQVPTFAVTLGAMGVCQAGSLMLSGQSTVNASDDLHPVEWMLNYRLLGLELAVWMSLGICLALWAFLRGTVIGQQLRSVGLNERASILSGVGNLRARVVAYTVSGTLAAMAGIFLVTQQGAAGATGAGGSLLLPGIAAAIVGGCAVTGGVARPINVLIGSLILALIPIGCAAVGVDPSMQQLIVGLIIVVAVVITIDRRRRGATK
ncbi:ABC transporter permease [Rhodococcus sp. NPDC057529]|uniref:ABC transporter permease n=1 Tax=Rhodococcus sp. NPDC057529 TaxID=3346158 RepID=UPI00366A76BE